MVTKSVSEAARLEELWRGGFGDAYSERCADAGANRGPFWQMIRARFPFDSALEVGCNLGSNLWWLAPHVSRVAGLDLNSGALRKARERLPAATLVEGSARALPFPSGSYDLVCAVGVLIHVADEALPAVMAEMVRVSRRYLLIAEYYAPERREVPYRGQEGALHKDNYGRRLMEVCPELRSAGVGFAGPEVGFDNITWWVFAK